MLHNLNMLLYYHNSPLTFGFNVDMENGLLGHRLVLVEPSTPSSLCWVCPFQLTSTFAALKHMMATRGLHLTMNVNMSRNYPLSQWIHKVIFVVRRSWQCRPWEGYFPAQFPSALRKLYDVFQLIAEVLQPPTSLCWFTLIAFFVALEAVALWLKQ